MNNFIFRLAFFLFLFNIKSSFSQSPGGFSSNLVVWLKADKGVYKDAGTSPALNNDNVQQWTNLAPLSTKNALQTVSSSQPFFSSSTYNYNPVISNPDNDRFITIPGLNLASNALGGGGIFVVYNYNDINQHSYASGPLSTMVMTPGSVQFGNVNFSGNAAGNGSFMVKIYKINGMGDSQFFNNFSTITSSISKNTTPNIHTLWQPGGLNSQYIIDGINMGSFDSNINFLLSDINLFRGWRNDFSQQKPYFMNGNIAEVIIYTDGLTTDIVNKIETYLSIKYSIGVNHNYINILGSVIYDISSYNNDVMVVGREIGEEFLQKQSHTIDDITRVYLSSLMPSNQSNTGVITNNNSYLAIGHNGGLMCSSNATKTQVPPEIMSRLDRQWKVSNSNFIDPFNMDFDLNGCSDISFNSVNDLRLLVDDDGDFTNAKVYSITNGITFSKIGSVISVSKISNPLISSNSTKFITLATSPLIALPLELYDFKAILESKKVKLFWSTKDNNLQSFQIEKSFDGKNWFIIDSVKLNESDLLRNEFSYSDENPSKGINYYKLTYKHDNKEFTFSKILSVNYQNDEIVLFPNPAENLINIINYTNAENKITITDLLGRKYSFITENHSNNTIINITSLPKGFYVIPVFTPQLKILRFEKF